jgi:NAD(P)-dependent dehydrogenase (short-subunit alcohol dehydrogenase family)
VSEQKVAVVIGCASALGLALAQEFGERGYSVVVTDSDEAELQSSTHTLAGSGFRVTNVLMDPSDNASLGRFASELFRQETVTALCLNAEISSAGDPSWQTDSELIDVALRDLWGVTNAIRAFSAYLVNQSERSHVLITATGGAAVFSTESPAYRVGKGAAITLAMSLHSEYQNIAPHVGVALMVPGIVHTSPIRPSRDEAHLSHERPIVQPVNLELRHLGLPAASLATEAVDAIENDRFWVLPWETDVYVEQLKQDIATLNEP